MSAERAVTGAVPVLHPAFFRGMGPSWAQFLRPTHGANGRGREKRTHNTLEKQYFSGWSAYLRMPSF